MTSSAIERLRADAVDEVLPLFASAYAANPRLQERDYIDWQFRDTPFANDDGYDFVVARREGAIAAFLGYLPVEVRDEDQVHRACWTQNWSSFGEQRSDGFAVLSEVMRHFDRRVHLRLSEDSLAIYRSLRIPDIPRLPRWVGVLDADAVCEVLSVPEGADRMRMHCSVGTLASVGATADAAVERVQRFEDDEELTLAAFPSVRAHTRRTGRYLNWRYVDIPRHDYVCLRVDGEGLVVFRIEDIQGHRCAALRIVEWTASGDAARSAMAYVLACGRERNVVLLDFFCTAEEVGRSLESLGLMPEAAWEHPLPYLFRPIQPMNEGIRLAIDLPPHRRARSLDFSRWYITTGDGDVDRVKL